MERLFDCDPAKRAIIAQERKFDLLEMAAVFEDESRIDIEDKREDYGEERRVTVGRAAREDFHRRLYDARVGHVADHGVACQSKGARPV